MSKLISQSILNKYAVKSVDIMGVNVPVKFKYTNIMNGDQDIIEISFMTNGILHKRCIPLPSIREDGLMQANGSVWSDIYMLIPPAEVKGTRTQYLTSIINTMGTGYKITDYMPKFIAVKPKNTMISQIDTRGPLDINNFNNWLAISLPYAIVQMFNDKIVLDVKRSFKPGFKGINATSSSIMSLVRAFSRYYRSTITDESINDYRKPEYKDTITNISLQDRYNYTIMHPIAETIVNSGINEPGCIDFCSGSVSNPIINTRLKSGTKVVNCKLQSTGKFPYTEWRRGVVGILSDDPHRVVVSRNIVRAMDIMSPSTPLSETEYTLDIPSLSLPGVRMTHPLNYEDGILVSKTFAQRMGAFKYYIQHITTPEHISVDIRAKVYNVDNIKDIVYDMYVNKSTDILNKGDYIGFMSYTDYKNENVFEEIHADGLRYCGIINKIEERTIATDMDINLKVTSITWISYLPMLVGDKLSDAHGNKATISEILPDNKMPIWIDPIRETQIQSHYIVSPECKKRMAIGGEIEDTLSLAGFYTISDTGDIPQLDSNETLPLDDAHAYLDSMHTSYHGSVLFNNKKYDGIPISMRRVFRLDNSVSEALRIRKSIRIEDSKVLTNNMRMSLELMVMSSKGCNNLVNSIIKDNGNGIVFKDRVVPIMNAIGNKIPKGAKSYKVSERLPRDIFSTIITSSMLKVTELENTVCDPRCKDHYGRIEIGKYKYVIPPHDGLIAMGGDKYILSQTGIASNRLIAEIRSQTRFGIDFYKIEGAYDRYINTLVNMIKGKSGMIRDSLPQYPISLRSVFTSFISSDDNVLQIMIPKTAYKIIMKENENINHIYSSNDPLVLLKRDPVHGHRSLVCVKFKVWNNKSIGIHPLLLTYLKGDFDGDEGEILFATSGLAYNDLSKLTPSLENILVPAKRTELSTPGTMVKDLNSNVGIGSSFLKPAYWDRTKREELETELKSGITLDNLSTECMNTIRDFHIIKSGTAKVGSVGLKFIYTRSATDPEILEQSMNLYHLMAQNTLDAKAGEPVYALEISNAFRTGDVPKARKALAALGFSHKKCIDQLVKMINDIHAMDDNKKLYSFLRSQYPVTACIQRGSSKDDAIALSNIITGRKKKIGRGFWENMFEHLSGISEYPVFNWSLNVDNLIK